MTRDFKLQQRAVVGVLALLLVADVALAAYSWKLSSALRTPEQESRLKEKQLELLRADIKRSQEIRQNVPAIQKNWDRFEQTFPQESVGYSTISADLGDVAKKSGVQIETLGFKPKQIASRGLTEVSVDAAVSGDYANVVRFVNGLQRSEHLYAMDSLALAQQSSQAPSNAIKVTMRLKTYFRTVA